MRSSILLLLVVLAAVAWILATTCGVSKSAALADYTQEEHAARTFLDSEPETAPLAAEPGRAPAPPELAAELPSQRIPPPRDAIHGRVISESGSGLAGALVRLWPLTGGFGPNRWERTTEPSKEAVATTHSEADGSFHVPGPLLGNYRLEAEYGGQTERRFPIPAGDYVEIRMGSGCRIAGSIRCNDHSTEVFQGSFWLAGDVFDRGALLAEEVARDGSFAFEGIPPGSYVVNGSLAGHVVEFGTNLRLSDWREEVPLIMPVQAGLVLAGQVRDADTDRPIEGATVWVGPLNEVLAIADADGHFRLDRITPMAGEWADLAYVLARAPGYVSTETPFEAGTDRLLLLKRAPPLPLRITGRLLNHKGQPVSGAQLHAAGRDDQDANGGMIPALERWTETGPDGAFRIEWDQNLATHIQVDETATGSYWIFLGKVVKDRELGDLRLPAALIWNLRLTDESGGAVVGAEVSVNSGSYSYPEGWLDIPDWLAGPIPFAAASRTTDSFGRCQLIAGPMESTGFSVGFGPFKGWSFPAPAPGDDEHVLVIDGLRRIHGRVRDAAGDPVAFGFLTIGDPEDDDSAQAWSSNEFQPLAEDGTFFLEGRYPPKMTFIVHLYGIATGEVRWDGIAMDEGPIELALPALLPCSGVVQDEAGRPLPAVMVLGGPGEEDERQICRTDAEGRFSFGMLLDARLRLVAQDDEGIRSAPQDAVAGTTGIVLQIKQ